MVCQNRKKRIILVTTAILSGHNRTQFQRTKLLAQNFDLHILAAESVCLDFLDIANVMICPGHLSYTRFIIFPLWVIFSIWTLRKQGRINVVYTSYHSLAIISGYLSSKLCGIRWIADIWDHPALEIESSIHYSRFYYKVKIMYFIVLHFFVRRVLRKADRIILALEPQALDTYGVDFNKTLHITNGVDVDYTKRLAASATKTTLTNTNAFCVTYVGDMYKTRGSELIIKSVDSLSKSINNLQVLLIGDGKPDAKKWLYSEIKKRNLSTYLKYLGRLSHADTLKIVKNSDICLYLFAPNEELRYIYPIKVFEYMALKKAVIATDLEGVRRVIRNGQNGVLIEYDVQSLSNAIEYLYEHPNVRKLLEENAGKDVMKYDWSIINDNVMRYITEFLEGN